VVAIAVSRLALRDLALRNSRVRLRRNLSRRCT